VTNALGSGPNGSNTTPYTFGGTSFHPLHSATIFPRRQSHTKIVWLLSMPTHASSRLSRQNPTAAIPRVPGGCRNVASVSHVFGSHTQTIGARPSCPVATTSRSLVIATHLTSSSCPKKNRCECASARGERGRRKAKKGVG
jgi:hypothetical protein